MTANILELPFRRSYSVDLSSAIKSYISSRYDQAPATFNDDLLAIDTLRADAISVQEPHVSGIKRLQVYVAQLRYLGGKFPIDLGVEFPWFPALGYNKDKPVLQNNIRFELANVLYNLAALYSQLAFSGNRTTSEGLKQAAQYGVAAAGTFAFLRQEVIPDMRATPPEDMDDSTLASLEQICLAQAQECFWQKAVKDGLKDGTIARLAAKVSDYYSNAGDLAIKSDAISTEWIHHFQAKHHHFAAAAQFRQSRDCLEKRRYGEEVARLRDSITCVNEALKESRWINRTVLGDLNGLKTRVTEELKRAEKDNDVIYMLPVTPKSELKVLERANMVTAKPPKEVAEGISMLGPGQPFGNPLFEKLVPYAVHQAASIYADRRDRLVSQSIIADLEAMTAKLRDLLQSLNLPGSLQALEKPLGLPPSLVSKAEELRQQDALYRIKRSVDDTAKLKTNDLSMYQEGLSLLESEKQEDDRARAKYGTDRWSREPSTTALSKLYQQASDLRTYLNSAGSSDNLVQTKIRENEEILSVLTGTNRDIESYVPSSRHVSMTPQIEATASHLRTVLNEISRLETKRKRKTTELQTKAKSDDITAALLSEAARLEREYPMQPISAAQFEPLFESRLEHYTVDHDNLTHDQEEQDQLVARLREANKSFLSARQGHQSSAGTAREKALQDLETGYVKYKEIISNLETGRKFYNDLAGHVSRFREQVKTTVNARRVEAGQLEADLTGQDLGRLKLEETRRELRSQRSAQQQQQQQQQHHQQFQQDGMHRTGAGVGMIDGAGEPLTAPVPTRQQNAATNVIASAATPMSTTSPGGGGPGAGSGGGGDQPAANKIWSPDMGIVFGGQPNGLPGQQSQGRR